MASHSLTEVDESTIDRTWTPEGIARRALDAARDDADDAHDLATTLLALGGDGIANQSHTTEALDGINTQTPFSDVLARCHHDPAHERFGQMAQTYLAPHDEDAQAALAAEWGRGMGRQVSERDLVDADEMPAGWTVGDVSDEGAAVDIEGPHGEKAQVATYISTTDDPLNGRGKRGKDKLDDEEVERLDFYIVLHATGDGEYGVGINNLNDDGIETGWGETANAKARRAAKAALE